jgi:hypothetical protein
MLSNIHRFIEEREGVAIPGKEEGAPSDEGGAPEGKGPD